MKKSELRRIIKEEISEMNFTGHGYDRDGGESSSRETEFTRNSPARINQFIGKLDDLIDEYHEELYLKDGVFTGIDAVKIAASGPDTTEDEEVLARR